MKSLMLVLFAASLLFACKKSGEPTNPNDFTVKIEQCVSRNLGGGNIQICLDDVISDSRCPANAMCVWQGIAVARFSFTENDITHTFKLGTIGFTDFAPKDTTIAGYRIEFMNLSPYPGIVPANPQLAIYRADLKITR